ncbi:hypothetical protein MD537_06910 [Flavihumibacter sediminis]|nr:hypothetical protein [Flavihumibacter sediminis]
MLRVSRLLIDLEIGPEDERISLTATLNRKLKFNIGKRWVIQPQDDEYLHICVATSFNEESVAGEYLGDFTTNGLIDAHWISVPFLLVVQIPESLYKSWKETCSLELKRTKRSRACVHHSPLLYLLITDPETRKEWDEWADLS